MGRGRAKGNRRVGGEGERKGTERIATAGRTFTGVITPYERDKLQFTWCNASLCTVIPNIETERPFWTTYSM